MRSLLILVFITYGIPSIAQTNSIDSSKSLLLGTTKPLERFEILDNLVLSLTNWRGTNIDSTYCFEMLELAQRLKNDSLLTISYNWLGSYFYLNKGDNSTALEYYSKALPLAEKRNDKRRVSSLYFDIALVYFDLLNNESAVENTRLGGKNLPDKSHYLFDFMLIQYQANMAQYFLLVNQPDSALFYANELAQTKTRLDGITNYDFVEATLKGYAYAQLNNPKKSDENFKKALLLSNSVESSSTSLLFYNSYIPFLFDNDRIEEARFLAKNLFRLGIKNKNNNIKLVAAGFLRQVFDAMHQIDSAYYYSQQEAVINAEIFSQNNVNRIQALAFNDQLRKIEEKSKEDSYQNRLRINAFLGSTFTLIVIAFFLFRNNRHKSKSKLKIEKAYDQLKATQTQLVHSEKLASLGELTAGIAHEIQNPLNFVNNFSDLNKELLDELKDAIAKNDQEDVGALIKVLSENESKINHHGKRAEEIVKSMLQHSRTGSGEKGLTDINLIADEYLRLAYHGLRAKDQSGSTGRFNAEFKSDLDPNIPKINVVPQDIGRVLLNLINNAFQAVHEKSMKAESGYIPTVTLTTELTVNGQLQIAIIDNGPGIPDDIKDKIFQPFFTTKAAGEGTGLGLSMSYDIVTKGHGGDLKVNTLKEEGSEFIIYLPTDI